MEEKQGGEIPFCAGIFFFKNLKKNKHTIHFDWPDFCSDSPSELKKTNQRTIGRTSHRHWFWSWSSTHLVLNDLWRLEATAFLRRFWSVQGKETKRIQSYGLCLSNLSLAIYKIYVDIYIYIFTLHTHIYIYIIPTIMNYNHSPIFTFKWIKDMC